MTASFDQALRAHPPLLRVGNVRLRYEGSLLIAESEASLEVRAQGLLIAGIGCGAACLALLLSPWSDRWLVAELLLGAAAGLLVTSSVRREAAARNRRRFVLNFADETLRLDSRASLRTGASVWIVPFDDVKAVERRGADLVVSFRRGERTEERVLVSGLPDPAQGDPAADQLERTLRAAFGL